MLSNELDDKCQNVERDFGLMYKSVLRQYTRTIREKTGARYFESLWGNVAPKGNIYRRNGLFAEHRKHSENLWQQIDELAEKYAHLLEGKFKNDAVIETRDKFNKELDLRERGNLLANELRTVKIEGVVRAECDPAVGARKISCVTYGSSDLERPADSGAGFLPLREFLSERVWRIGPFVIPDDTESMRSEMHHIIMGVGVFGIQFVTPLIIFMNRWTMGTNYLAQWWQREGDLTWAELFCPGVTFNDKLTTIMAVLLLSVLIFMVRCYTIEQQCNAKKSSKLPMDGLWYGLGNFANQWCCTLISLCFPLLFWSEDSPTGIVLDSMTLLFVFKLDDMSDILCQYLDMDEISFQRILAWSAALLSQCPVSLKDVINSNATRAEELWCIKYGDEGHLLTTEGQICETRVAHARKQVPAAGTADETTSFSAAGALLPAPGQSAQEYELDPDTVIYRPAPGKQIEMPTAFAGFCSWMWTVIIAYLWFAQFVIPIGWYFVNKPCWPADLGPAAFRRKD